MCLLFMFLDREIMYILLSILLEILFLFFLFYLLSSLCGAGAISRCHRVMFYRNCYEMTSGNNIQ